MSEALTATLPMYDWAAVRPATDTFWAALGRALRSEGYDAPSALNRNDRQEMLWRSPRLILGQTCGFPYVSTLRDKVTLVGTPDYGVPDCPPGWYRSVIVVRGTDPRPDLEAYRGATLVVNGRDSQSGTMAMMHSVARYARPLTFFGTVQESGSHANSIRTVADGVADIAAIDSVTWRLATAHQLEASRLRVLTTTEAAPGLPFIAARRFDAGSLASAVEKGMASLDPATAASLGIRGFVRTKPEDYDIIQKRAAAAAPVSAAHDLLSGDRSCPLDA